MAEPARSPRLRLGDLAGLEARLGPHFLTCLGAFHPEPAAPELPDWVQTLVLLGPRQPGFWPHVTAQPEFHDGRPDPLDRWSRRVIGREACALGGKALFPFGGPPWHPFLAWAQASGQVFASPLHLLVHVEQGLMVSFRGALALPERLVLPAPATRPCEACAAPCLTACPVGAMTPRSYDTAACHAFLDRPEGADCLARGCPVRRACPVSQAHARMEVQSAWHMRQFHR